MKDFFKSRIFRIFLVISVALLLLIAATADGRETVLSRAANDILAPVQKVFSFFENSVGGFFKHFGDISELQETNAALQDKIAELESKNRMLEDYQTENERLRALLDLKENESEYETVGCSVVAKDSGNWFDTFTIDKGIESGIRKDQVVITTGGLVGRINEAGDGWAKVVSIIDSTSSVGCSVVRTGDIAVAEGDISLQKQGLCKMSYMSKGSDVAVGDVVETSGLGGVFPKGFVIGTVKEIHSETDGLSQYATIDPSADLEKVSEVMVIIK